MRKHQFPATIQQNALQINNFLGADFTNSKSEVAINRSPDVLNLVLNEGGNLEKRNGFKLLVSFGYSVVMIHKASIKTSSNTIIEILLCQVNGELRVYKTDGALIRPYETASYKAIVGVPTLSATKPIKITSVDGNGMYHLLTGGGLAKPLILKLDFANAETGTASIIDLSDNTLANYDTFVNVPVTHIGRTPVGVTTTEFEQRNVLSHYEENTFMADGTAVYKPSGTLTSDVKVWVRSGSTWTLKTVTTHYTVDTGAGTVTFTTGNIPTEPTDGADNVKIRFVSGAKALEKVYSATSFGEYGFGGLRDYLFLSGYDTTNKELIPMEYFGKRELPLQFGEFDHTTYPSKVVGYSHFGSYHVVLCEEFGNQPTVYLRSANLDAAGEVIFPLQSGVSGVGTLSGKSIAILKDEPLWLSEYGVMAIVSTESINKAADRGYYINNDLLTQSGLSNALGFVWDNRYHLAIGSTIYVADSRYLFNQRNAQSGRQYEWFKWRLMNSIATLNGQCEFGGRCYLAANNGIYFIKNDTDTNPNQDEISNYADDTDVAFPWDFEFGTYTVGAIVEYDGNYYECILEHAASPDNYPLNTTYWEPYTTIASGFASAFNSGGAYYHFSNMVYYNNAYWVCKRDHVSSVAKAPVVGSEYWVLASIYTEIFSASQFYHRIMVPVVSYWTTPILNMGNISVKKTLKNMWVRLHKYPNMVVKVYYSTMGLVKEQYDGYFDFSDIDFSHLSFSTDTDPLVMVTNRQERKFMSIQFKIESDDYNPFGMLEILLKYTINNQYKG